MLYEAGFQVLVNEAVAVEKEGKRLWISGVDDCKKGRPDPEQAYHNIEPDDIHVSLMHNPRFAPHLAVQQLAPHLILSGHTHGGQVKHFLVNWAHIHLFENPYQYGWFTFLNHSQLYVTSGVGSASVAVHTPAFDFSLYPFRVNTTAEVAVFELTGQPIVEASSLEMPEILTLIR
jgi:uncharacterized protein